MRKILATALVLFPMVASADGLSGRWNVRMPTEPGYEGVILIDGQQRVIFDAPADNGRPAKFLGYVSFNDGSRIEMALTNRADVAHINCLAASSDMLHCHTVRGDKSSSAMYSLVRVGPAPANLAARH